ncbi:MAG: peptidase U32 family protein [Bacteroidota bacterium]
MMKTVEILSPVGSFESLAAAMQAGADAVYFGVGKLNMRSRSSVNFTVDDLAHIAELCRKNNIKSYLTLNTVVYDEESAAVDAIIASAKTHQMDAVIASDFSIIEKVTAAGLKLHISTQCNITNIGAVRFFSKYADVMVLARELNLGQVKHIVDTIEKETICGPSGELIKIEVFAHGALCMAVSGKCYLSLDNYNYSANRGACFQLCRRGYRVQDKESELELAIDNEFIMSPKDLCTIGFLDKLVAAGVKVLKIEGRGRSPEYVKTVTACYKEAIDSIAEGTYSQVKIANWVGRLQTVFNRGFWDGYYLGQTLGEWNSQYGSVATKEKMYVGKITNYYANIKVAEIKIESNHLNLGDEFIISGNTTGVYEDTVAEIRVDLSQVETAIKGDTCSIPVSCEVRRGDKLYKLLPKK